MRLLFYHYYYFDFFNLYFHKSKTIVILSLFCRTMCEAKNSETSSGGQSGAWGRNGVLHLEIAKNAYFIGYFMLISVIIL